MEYGDIVKQMVMHFIIAVVITVMVVFALSTVKIDNLTYLGVFLGLYIFAGYGINRLTTDGLIESFSQKFVLAIICIIIFYLFFVYLMPFIFNMAIFGIVKIGSAIALNSLLIFIIFSVIVLMVALR